MGRCICRWHATWQAAKTEGRGVSVLDGKLVETMHVDDAQRILALAESLKQLQEQAP